MPKVINPVAVRLKLPRTMRCHPMFHVSHIKLAKQSKLVPATKAPPAPRIVDGEPVYLVKKTSGCYPSGPWTSVPCRLGGIWSGGQNILASNILDPSLIQDFFDRQPDTLGPSGARLCERGNVRDSPD